jgi:hypothetical protein
MRAHPGRLPTRTRSHGLAWSRRQKLWRSRCASRSSRNSVSVSLSADAACISVCLAAGVMRKGALLRAPAPEGLSWDRGVLMLPPSLATRLELSETSLSPPRHRQRTRPYQQTPTGPIDHKLHARPPDGAARR